MADLQLSPYQKENIKPLESFERPYHHTESSDINTVKSVKNVVECLADTVLSNQVVSLLSHELKTLSYNLNCISYVKTTKYTTFLHIFNQLSQAT